MMNPDLIIFDPGDNVATALKNVPPGQAASVSNAHGERRSITPVVEIHLGHKLALSPILAGELVVKHGHAIGRATADIAIGEHVHVHNVVSLSRETDVEQCEEGT
jgi:hypothetical protein